MVFQSAKPHLKDTVVIVDGSGSREFKQKLQTYLRSKADGTVKKVKIQDSRKNNLLQLADMITGSVHRSYSDKEDATIYRKIIAPRELQVQRWPN